ncbi:glycoside hydrolase family 43 protein [Sediminitomix flava]|uniref:Alpha-N-arabinofuranosidase n=1 Tax=Sediminitomix flava TaxID=379075 RepID=A0A315Z4I6_SEDFL|nr:glycoside hydrolase family 43 protein [Sediminitomix flava]PWJ37994.1 alpha-N-arabinofuranosidase [Sediminitomix flava]
MKKIFLLFTFLIASLGSLVAQPETFKNPILPGFHPDPSICRVGEDYYLATSSFEWFPGVPIYHSKDLVNWELIGHALDRPEQLPKLINTKTSRGIYAPTLRYHEGTFYMITTCVQCDGNFYVTATDPAGPWSDPVWLPDAKGIDPSIFWDEDGRSWYTGAGRVQSLAGPWEKQNGIWLQEIDLKAGKMIGPKVQLTHGHGSMAHYTEGPHLYKIDGRYMLMVAEGGTGFPHAITVFESEDIKGPYIPSQINPVLTHRHLGSDYPITTIGHGDLVQTQNGDWWAVMLGKRQLSAGYLLARETFLTPVNFENGFPVFNQGHGKVLAEDKRPNLPWTPFTKLPAKDDFESSKLRLEYNFLRTPQSQWYQLNEGQLQVELRAEKLTDEQCNPSMIVKRLESEEFTASTKLSFKTKKLNEASGLTVFRNAQYHYTLAKKNKEIVLSRIEKGVANIVKKVSYKENDVVFSVKCDKDKFIFSYGKTENDLQQIGEPQESRIVGDNVTGGFNGPYVGMFASSYGEKSKAKASFDWFYYKDKVDHVLEN